MCILGTLDNAHWPLETCIAALWCVCMWVHIYVYTHTHTWIYIYTTDVCARTRISEHWDVCVCIYVFVMYMCVCVCACVCVYIYVYVYISTYIVCVCVYRYIFCVYMCVCRCVGACVCVCRIHYGWCAWCALLIKSTYLCICTPINSYSNHTYLHTYVQITYIYFTHGNIILLDTRIRHVTHPHV